MQSITYKEWIARVKRDNNVCNAVKMFLAQRKLCPYMTKVFFGFFPYASIKTLACGEKVGYKSCTFVHLGCGYFAATVVE